MMDMFITPYAIIPVTLFGIMIASVFTALIALFFEDSGPSFWETVSKHALRICLISGVICVFLELVIVFFY